MLDAFAYQLCSKICLHNPLTPTYADGLAVMVGWTFKCVVLSMNLFTRYSNLNLLISSAGGENPQETIKVVSMKQLLQHYYTVYLHV